jgi:hypothetical protein
MVILSAAWFYIYIYIYIYMRVCVDVCVGARGSVMAKALCYEREGHGFETLGVEWFLSIYLILPDALGPGVHSASNRNEHQRQM